MKFVSTLPFQGASITFEGLDEMAFRCHFSSVQMAIQIAMEFDMEQETCHCCICTQATIQVMKCSAVFIYACCSFDALACKTTSA